MFLKVKQTIESVLTLQQHQQKSIRDNERASMSSVISTKDACVYLLSNSQDNSQMLMFLRRALLKYPQKTK